MFNTLADIFNNAVYNQERYRTAHDAVIVACFYNPENNPYRLIAFHQWYKRIKHLNHRIVECLIGPDAKSQLPQSEFITQVKSESLLWHKETLLNNLIRDLPSKFKYVFWLDTDVIFTNLNWMPDAVHELKYKNIVQPFEYCFHLEQNQLEPSPKAQAEKAAAFVPPKGQKRVWRSFCANVASDPATKYCTNYDNHGHVGFAWGARREVLEQCPLFDKALIGGADHIIAHAATGHPGHECVTKAFKNDLDSILEWGNRFYKAVEGSGNAGQPRGVSYVPGDLYHIWHGDIAKREYLKRIQEFSQDSQNVIERDENGLYVAPKSSNYMQNYYRHREVRTVDQPIPSDLVGDFMDVMGYRLAYETFLTPRSYVTDQISAKQKSDLEQAVEDMGVTIPESFPHWPPSPEPAPVTDEIPIDPTFAPDAEPSSDADFSETYS